MAGLTYKSNLHIVLEALNGRIERNVERACIYLQNQTKRTLTGQRSGRIYRVAGTKQRYQASAPGEPPAVRTGMLRNSIKYTVHGVGLSVKGVVGTGLQYGEWLETGTSKMAPRPFLGPTFERERLAIKRILEGR